MVQDFFQQQYCNGIFANCRIRYIFGAWLDYGVNFQVELLFLKKTDDFHGCMKYPCGQIRSSFGFQSLQKKVLWLWQRSQKKTSFFPEKKTTHVVIPIWFITHLLNKSWCNKPPPPWSLTLQGYPKISPLNPPWGDIYLGVTSAASGGVILGAFFGVEESE